LIVKINHLDSWNKNSKERHRRIFYEFATLSYNNASGQGKKTRHLLNKICRQYKVLNMSTIKLTRNPLRLVEVGGGVVASCLVFARVVDLGCSVWAKLLKLFLKIS